MTSDTVDIAYLQLTEMRLLYRSVMNIHSTMHNKTHSALYSALYCTVLVSIYIFLFWVAFFFSNSCDWNMYLNIVTVEKHCMCTESQYTSIGQIFYSSPNNRLEIQVLETFKEMSSSGRPTNVQSHLTPF